MALLQSHDLEQLRANGQKRLDSNESDFHPVVKLFIGSCTWLLTDIEVDRPDCAFGLCDLGQGFPELGSVLISEIESININGFQAERDNYFEAIGPISEYLAAARNERRIVESW